MTLFVGLQNLYSSVRLRSAPPKSPKSPEINTSPAEGVPADGSERPQTAPGGPQNWPKTGPALAPGGPSAATLIAAGRERFWLFLAQRVPRQWWHAGGRREAIVVALYGRHHAAAQAFSASAAKWPDRWQCLYRPHDTYSFINQPYLCRRCGAQGADGPPAPAMLAQIIDALRVAIIGTLIAAAIAVTCAMCAAYVFHVYLNLRGGF